MEKDRSTKTMAIVALMVAVVSLSVGFAAFSSALTISSSAAVSPSDTTFNVDFSSSASAVATDAIVPTVTGDSDASATDAAIDNSGAPKITSLTASFKEPGDKAVYTFYAYNAGEYIAYLKSISFENVSSGSSPKVCTAGSGTTDSLVQAACDDITLSISVGGTGTLTGSKTGITGHSLDVAESEVVTVTIEYASTGDRADGDFTVQFGDIQLLYSSVD